MSPTIISFSQETNRRASFVYNLSQYCTHLGYTQMWPDMGQWKESCFMVSAFYI